MACVRVAIRDGVICGYIMGKIENRPPVFVRKRAGMIGDLAVAADYRRLGIGRLLADDIFKWFKSHDIDRVELILLSANPLSTQFWQALGFEAYSCRMFREI
jgi:ribosomal protein S18 acetylase RimI-like enzyme